MRCLCSLAVIASFLVISWNAPLRAEDESARRAKILEQVAQTLDQAELPDEAKQAVLRDLKISLAKALDGTVEVQRSAAEEQTQDQPPNGEAVTDADAEAAEAAQDRRERSRQRARAAQREQRREQRREPSRDPAAEARRPETPQNEAERQRRQAQDSAPQPPRYAIGVMLEKLEEADAEGRLVITDVFPGSPAAEADLKSGDVIRKLNGEELTDPQDVTQRVNQAGLDDQPLSLEIGRGEEVLTVEVKPSPRPGDGGIFGFGRPDWSFPAAPGMPGFGGWRDPQWRFPTPPQGADSDRIAEIIQRIERHERMLEQLQQAVEEIHQERVAESESDDEDEDSEED